MIVSYSFRMPKKISRASSGSFINSKASGGGGYWFLLSSLSSETFVVNAPSKIMDMLFSNGLSFQTIEAIGKIWLRNRCIHTLFYQHFKGHVWMSIDSSTEYE